MKQGWRVLGTAMLMTMVAQPPSAWAKPKERPVAVVAPDTQERPVAVVAPAEGGGTTRRSLVAPDQPEASFPRVLKIQNSDSALADFRALVKYEAAFHETQRKMDEELAQLRRLQDQFSQKYGVELAKLRLRLIRYDEAKKAFVEMEGP